MEPEGQGYVNQDGPQEYTPEVEVELEQAAQIELDIISEAMVKTADECEKQLKLLNSCRPYIRVAEEAVGLFGGRFHMYQWTGRCITVWVMEVSAFKDVEHLINWLEEECHLTATATVDDASKWSSYRTYQFGDCFWFRAELKEDSENCKKVLIGYEKVEPQPIYKFECKEAE